MSAFWPILCAAGVPVPYAASQTAPTPTSVREALVAASEAALSEPEREALAAWLCAWRSHWPTAFDSVLGQLGPTLEGRIAWPDDDPNRHIKLRRIALERLARWL